MNKNHEAGVGAKLALLAVATLGAAGCNNSGPTPVQLPNDRFPNPVNLGYNGHYGRQPNLMVVGPTGQIYREGTNCALVPSNKSLLQPDSAKPSTLNFSGAYRSPAVSSEESIQDIVVVCQTPFNGTRYSRADDGQGYVK